MTEYAYNANGNVWSYTYDADDRMTAKTNPLGNKTVYTYDAAGNLLKTTSAKSMDERHFYLQLCAKEHYSKRELERSNLSPVFRRGIPIPHSLP